MRAHLVAFAVGFLLGGLAYLAAVEISFRMLGNDVQLSPAHRRALDA